MIRCAPIPLICARFSRSHAESDVRPAVHFNAGDNSKERTWRLCLDRAQSLRCVLLGTLAATSQAAEYIIVDLGTFGGTMSEAWDINNVGQVAGGATLSTGVEHPFLWTPGATDGFASNPQMKDLNLIAGRTSGRALGLNNTGIVVGENSNSSSTISFIWRQATGIQTLGITGSSTDGARKVNDAGLVCGYRDNSQGRLAYAKDTVLGTQTLMNQLIPANGASDGWAINNLGQLIGDTDVPGPGGHHAFRWSQATGMVDLGTLQAGQFSWGMGTNELGVVVGEAIIADPTTKTRGFMYTSAGGWVNLGAATNPANGQPYKHSSARDINSCGTIVGRVWDDNPSGGSPLTRAAMWDTAHGFRDLNALHPAHRPHHRRGHLGTA